MLRNPYCCQFVGHSINWKFQAQDSVVVIQVAIFVEFLDAVRRLAGR
jgi:hypothetical protein